MFRFSIMSSSSLFLVSRIKFMILVSILCVIQSDSSFGESLSEPVCYFPIEFQGTFLIQSRNHEQQVGSFGGFSPRVMGPSSMSAALGHQTDSEITIESEGIPPWGSCHKRRGNNFILKDSSGPYDCMRCFHLTLKSPNVVQIHAEGLSRCYTNEAAAQATCPTEDGIREGKFKEFLLIQPSPLVGSAASVVETSRCRFPDWTQGRWERVRVEGNMFTFKDEVLTNFRAVTSSCIMRQNNSPHDRFVVLSTNPRGEKEFKCIWFKRRSPNILEFQYASKTGKEQDESLCDDIHFITTNWITQGRKVVTTAVPCPIMGDFTGEIPGTNSQLCAKIASDCNNPDIMFYTVTSCDNRTHVYEEREYRCLGNWEEDSILYTYTQRRDMPGHQCFVGKIYKSGGEVFIKEAGEVDCIRGEDPLISGMKITKQASCPRRSPVSLYSSLSSSSSSEPQSTMSRRNYDRIPTTISTTSTTTTSTPPPPPPSSSSTTTPSTTMATRLFFRTARPFGGTGLSNFPATSRFNTYSGPTFFSTSSPSSSPIPPLFFSSSSSSSSSGTKHQKPLQFQGVNWPHPGRTLPPPVTSSSYSLNSSFNQFLILLFILTTHLVYNNIASRRK